MSGNQKNHTTKRKDEEDLWKGEMKQAKTVAQNKREEEKPGIDPVVVSAEECVQLGCFGQNSCGQAKCLLL